jgi:hypothetical protein
MPIQISFSLEDHATRGDQDVHRVPQIPATSPKSQPKTLARGWRADDFSWWTVPPRRSRYTGRCMLHSRNLADMNDLQCPLIPAILTRRLTSVVCLVDLKTMWWRCPITEQRKERERKDREIGISNSAQTQPWISLSLSRRAQHARQPPQDSRLRHREAFRLQECSPSRPLLEEFGDLQHIAMSIRLGSDIFFRSRRTEYECPSPYSRI